MRPMPVARAIVIAVVLAAPVVAGADDAPKKSAPPAAAAAPAAGKKLSGMDAVRAMPRYVRPLAFSEDMVITTDGREMTMRQYIDRDKKRIEMNFEGQSMITIQMGGEKGTIYTLMPDQKRAVKYDMDKMDIPAAATPDTLGPADTTAVPADFQVEELGEETIDGVLAQKLHISTAEGDMLAWFDKTTGAPLRMQNKTGGKDAVLEWKNRKVAPQPKELFEIPKGYDVTDMSAMMAGMGGMGGAGAMAKGMGAGMVGGMGQSMGAGLGSSLGGALGGPLGAIAGQYIGGKIGGALAKKATNAIVN